MVKCQLYVPTNAIQRTAVIFGGFGTDKSVPYEKNQLFPIQRTGAKSLPGGTDKSVPYESPLQILIFRGKGGKT